MDFDILHSTPGRLRVHCRGLAMTRQNAYALRETLLANEGVVKADLCLRTGNLLFVYSRLMPLKQALVLLLRADPREWRGDAPADFSATPVHEKIVCAISKKIFFSALKQIILPSAAQCVLLVWKALPHLAKGVWSFLDGRFDAAAMEASAIAYLLMRNQFRALRTFLHLASAAELLWTMKRSAASVGCGKTVLEMRRDNKRLPKVETA